MSYEVSHAPDSSHICVGCSNLFDAPTGPAVVPAKHDAEVASFTAIQDESMVFDLSGKLTFQTTAKSRQLKLSNLAITPW